VRRPSVMSCVAAGLYLPGRVLCGSHTCAPLREGHSEEDRSWGGEQVPRGRLYLVCKFPSREHATPAQRGGILSTPLFLRGVGVPDPLLALGWAREGADRVTLLSTPLRGEKPQHFAVLAPTGARVGRAPSGHLSPAKSAALREHGKHVHAYPASSLRESRGNGCCQQSRKPPVIDRTV
jgi:hypothetical protein